MSFLFDKRGLPYKEKPYFYLVATVLVVSFLVNAALFLWSWNVVRSLGDVIVPLHRTVYFGIDFLGQPWTILLLPAFAFVLWCVHAGLGVFFASKNRFWMYMLWASFPFIQLYVTLGTLVIIRNF